MSGVELLTEGVTVGMVIEAGVTVGRHVIRRECCVEEVSRYETATGPRTYINGRFRIKAGGWSKHPRQLQRPWILVERPWIPVHRTGR